MTRVIFILLPFDTYRKELYSTAISADFVNMIMSRSKSKRQVLLLDCCYSGAFAKGMISKGADKEVHTKEHFDGHGRIILTASDAMQYSFEGDELKGVGVAECSIFTQAIVQGLKTGDADLDNDGNISPDELYDYTFDLVRRKTPLQKPGKWALGVEGDITIASTETTKNRKEEQQPLKLLEEGRIDEFNKIRKLKDVPLYFKKIDQSYKDLHGADLHDVDFTGAKLINTKLRMANLNGANFRDANLSGAELRGAELYRADLSGANLTNADLRNANLKGMIDFTGANLTAPDLRGADLKGIINFADATLYDVNFTGANITKGLVNFRGAKIRNVVGLSADLYIYNKYVKDLRAFGALIEKQFKSLSISSEDLKNVEESIKELEKEIEDIDGERLTETRKRDIKTKLLTVLEKITGIILIENENTLNDFVSLNSFNELIGEDILSVLHSLKGFRRTNMYLEGLRSFSEAIQEQFSVNNISSEQLVPIKEGIKELEKELEDVHNPKTINSIKREELKTKLIELC